MPSALAPTRSEYA